MYADSCAKDAHFVPEIRFIRATWKLDVSHQLNTICFYCCNISYINKPH